MTLIAEDLLLLLLDDDSGKPLADSTKLPRVLAGALVVELAMTGSLRITGLDEQIKKDHVVVAGSRPEDEFLRRVFDLVASASRPMKPQKVIEKSQKNLAKELAARLVAQGFVTEKKDKVLGLFPTTTWPAQDTSREKVLRDALRSALVDGTTPSPHTAALISLISAVDLTHKVIEDADKKLLKRRAKEIAEGEWAGAAVRKAVSDVNAAVMAAVMVPVIVSTTSS
ncbi:MULTISPECIES: GPP34 family phosphoprotein [unclassified Rhodococcus (in: high G+C Gram-positive bacteria)]|uniref:GOLPH3/VPS74 family protein n=1 Tax=unclassified Rhodococcus (in: high G+C Gram-positive bacteria) TaxID=192944 RepID=UPI000B9C08BD|nr:MULTISPECIES: GPP34 family phosphoprotein [unclassified Rhodococcus (in: high G+C Gram-positive bacteria)]OZE23301.1 GPP34 family phosphoprotein [Rhodococcus sp. 05-2254-6]OZE32960.1 GPP34 family phosphoprotein [Rhodococcus sp. 05-2254-4]OZE44146.1 GPP34 family phosphoprotein [Rhodococcus sp. 05-2254-3]OZE56174.1 GPP34 family phosphoprotein [Rhodococcus sp. 05-2254-2]